MKKLSLKQQLHLVRAELSTLSEANVRHMVAQEEAEAQLRAVNETYEDLLKRYDQLMKSSNAGLADGMKIGQLEKKLLVIDHITAGRANEAIQEILKPLPLVFAVDVRFADDKTRIAAEDELLERIKGIVVETVGKAKIIRKNP